MLSVFSRFSIGCSIIVSGMSSLTHCTCDTRNRFLSHAHMQNIFAHACNRDTANSFTSIKDRRIKMPRVLGHYLLYNSYGPTSVTVHALLVSRVPNCVR